MYDILATVAESDDGTLRAVIVADHYAEAPYDDGGSPILRMYYDYGWRAKHVDGVSSFVPSGIGNIIKAAERWARDDSDLFERYLRIFHGMTSVRYHFDRDGDEWVTFDTAEWRECVGAPEGAADMTEYIAWLNGECYGYAVERKVTWHADGFGERESWETIDSCFGFYGWTDYLRVEARGAYESARVTA